MKLSKRILAIFIAFTLMLSAIPQILDLITQKALAATAGNVSVDIAKDSSSNWKLTANSVTLTWKQVTGATSYDLSYYDIKTGSSVTQSIGASVSDAVYQIDNLETDFVYDFIVTAKNNSNTAISTNNRKIITGISMDVSAIDQDPMPMTGGGYEVGVEPELKFRIKIPATYNSSSLSVADYTYDKIDYDINMGNNVGGSDLDRIKVRYSSTAGVNQYIATTFMDNQVMTVASKVYTGELEPGYMNFFVKGQNSRNPTDLTPLETNSTYAGAQSGFSSSNISEDVSQTGATVNLANIMRDIEITPSMAIRMTILPIIHDSSDANSVRYLQTSVSGGYVSTPIRFQINKDSSNNIIATIYRVNQGTSFTYELHASASIDFPPPALPQTSNIIASRSDKDAGTSTTLRIYIEKQSNNSTYYFKVVAYDSGGDTLSSSPIGYAPSQDSPLAPLPEGLKVLSVTQSNGMVIDTFYNKDNVSHSVKSADVKLIWNKPSNYTDLVTKMTASGATSEDVVNYHIALSSFSDGGSLGTPERFDAVFGDVLNQYTVQNSVYSGYREIYNIPLTACDVVDSTGSITANGSYLSFTFKGLSLFSNVTGTSPSPAITQDLTMNTAQDLYPTYLLPNRIYYTKMFTTKGTAPQSDNSLAVSFTTPLDAQKTPLAPNNFKLIENKMDTNSNNYVKLEWSKINFNLSSYTANTSVSYSVYYDLYISDSMDINTFALVGSGEQTRNVSTGDAAFVGLANISTVVDATVSQFPTRSADPSWPANIGAALNPNSTYYFAVKSRVAIAGALPTTSGFSQILSVTTTKGDINPHDTGKTVPKAPQDFSIAVDSSGNKIMDSSSVSLTWTKLETDVKYILIQIATKIDSSITLDNLTSQGISYTTLLDSPGKDEADQDGTTFTYNATTKKFTYKVSGLIPNTVYYYSLRAVRTDSSSGDLTQSIWISLPVTTTLIEAPDLLSAVTDNEVGVWWELDNTDNFNTADSYEVIAHENGSSTGATIPRSQVSITKVAGTSITRYYARIVSLKKNTQYSFDITAYKKGTAVGNTVTISNSETGEDTHPMVLNTREDKHEIDVKWKGKDGYSFELAIKGENDTDYTVLKEDSDRFIYLSKEKTTDLVGTGFTMYYARIKTTDGSTLLKSNAKYYIKVRSVSVDTSVTDAIRNLSKYIGPVNTRTEYSQSDYDDKEQTNKENASYADKVKKFKESIYWEMGNDTGIYKLKLRKDRAENFIKNDSGNSFVIDFTTTTRTDINNRAVYIPLSTMKLLAARNENLILRVPGSEFTLKPGTIDLDNTNQITNVVDNSSVKETYIYIEIDKLADLPGNLPYNKTDASAIQSFNVKVKGTNISEADIEQAIKTELDGLIATGLTSLQGTDSSYKDTSQKLNDEIDNIVSGFESTLIVYIRDYIEGSTSISSKIQDYEDITSFSKPLNLKMSFNSSVKGTKAGYVYNDSDWVAKTSFVSNANNTVTFDSLSTGDYTIFSTGTTGMFNIPEGHWAQKDIDAFTSKYDISSIFQNDYYANIDGPITVKDTVLVIEKVLSAPGKSSSSSVTSSKAKELGLDGTINFSTSTKNLTRQELASLLMRVYKIKSGVDPGSMKASKTIIINDDSSISKSHYKEVEMCIDMKILSIDDKKNFRPNETCSKAQFLSAFTRMLKIVGEL